MFSKNHIWFELSDGLRLLGTDGASRLAILDAARQGSVAITPQPVTQWCAAMGPGGTAHLLLLTRAGGLLYGLSGDGRQWRKYTLVSGDATHQIRDPLMAVVGAQVHIAYIARQQQADALVYYCMDEQGRWHGQTLLQFPADQGGVSLLQILGVAGDVLLYILFESQQKAQIRQVSLQSDLGQGREVCSAPLPLTHFNGCSLKGEPHLCWISEGRVFADGIPLTSSTQCTLACMDAGADGLYCAWIEPGGARRMKLTAMGWQPTPAPLVGRDPTVHEIHSPRGVRRSLQAPLEEVTAAGSPADLPPNASRFSAPVGSSIEWAKAMAQIRALTSKVDRLNRQVQALSAAPPPSPPQPPKPTPIRQVQEDAPEVTAPAPRSVTQGAGLSPVREPPLSSPADTETTPVTIAPAPEPATRLPAETEQTLFPAEDESADP